MGKASSFKPCPMRLLQKNAEFLWRKGVYLLLETIKKRIEQKVLFTIMKNLKDKDIKELDQKLEKGASEAEAITFMASRVPDFKEKVSSALSELYDELVEDSKKLAGK